MRKLLLAAVTGALALGAMSAQAMPTIVVAPAALPAVTLPAVTLVAGGCGFGFHRFGFACVPNRRVVVVRRVLPVCVTRVTPFGAVRRVCR